SPVLARMMRSILPACRSALAIVRTGPLLAEREVGFSPSFRSSPATLFTYQSRPTATLGSRQTSKATDSSLRMAHTSAREGGSMWKCSMPEPGRGGATRGTIRTGGPEIPSSKYQIPNKFEVQTYEIRNGGRTGRKPFWILALCILDLFGIWSLGFGISAQRLLGACGGCASTRSQAHKHGVFFTSGRTRG